MEEVQIFCDANGFQDEVETFQKGALVAQNPGSFEDLPLLTEDDRYYLRRETTHRWHHPKTLYLTVATLSLGEPSSI